MNIIPSSAAQTVETAQSVAGRIAGVLAERIVSGTLPPGSRLMQNHVAEEFQASHVPVREAFRKLEAQGLVISKPRCGVRVTPLDPGMVLEVTEMRAVLEGLALHHALPRLGRTELDAAHQAIVECEATNKIAVWEAANRRFHLAITAPCGMARLMESINDLHRSDARFLFATRQMLDWQLRSDTEHRAILDAIERGEGTYARERLESHVREAGRALMERLEIAAADADALSTALSN
jgi:DNA-binding GntR family transcriptional regulator